MTYAAPSFDFYDDGLVHSHDWSRNTPPGRAPREAARSHATRQGHEHEEAKSHSPQQ